MGGLDEYILRTPDKKLMSDKAQELRARLLTKARETYEQEETLARALGSADVAVDASADTVVDTVANTEGHAAAGGLGDAAGR